MYVRSKVLFSTCFITAAAAAFACSSAQASPVNLIKDGSFENPNIGKDFYRNYGIPTQNPWSGFSFDNSWLIFSNNVDIVSDKGAPGGAPAASGNQYLDLVGYGSTGGIAQIFKTTPGADYTVSFEYGNNPWSTATASASVSVFGLKNFHVVDLATEDFTHTGSTDSDINWSILTFSFIADSTFTTLAFDNTVGSNNGGILLDAVSVVDPAPIPGTVMLFGSGLALFGFFTWNRRRKDGLNAAPMQALPC
jgi:hypothetical protein